MSNLWQSSDWKAFQESRGHKAHWLDFEQGKALMIIHESGYGIRYGYIPRGPQEPISEITHQDHEMLSNMAHKHKLTFVRIDPTQQLKLTKYLKRKESHSPQPTHTRILDISRSEEDILKQMKRKGRYNIQLAEKKELELESGKSTELVSRFYKLLNSTTQRDGFHAHDEEYYQKFVKHISSSEVLMLKKGSDDLAAMILIKDKPQSIYYYGASSSQNRELMAPYLLQWEAIKRSKASGAVRYDLLGIAPKEASSDHPWKGITQFKNKFGGEEVNYPAAKDLVFNPWRYHWFLILKGIQAVLKRR